MATKRIITPNTQESDTITQSASNSGFKHIVCPEDNLENYLTPDGGVLCKKWFLKAYPFQCGFGRVLCQMEDGTAKWNFVTSSGEFLSENYFIYADDFVENFAVVSPSQKYNYLTSTGDLLLPSPVFNLEPFSEGYGLVQRDIHVFNFIKPDGTCLTPVDYTYAESFHNGIALVCVETETLKVDFHSEWNYIQLDGSYVSRYWFCEKPTFGENDCALVQRVNDYMVTFLKKEGSFLCDDWWFRIAKPFQKDFLYAVVKNGLSRQNLLKRDGTLLRSQKWYRNMEEIYPGIVLVQDDENHYNLILPSGEFLFKAFVTDTWLQKDRDGIVVLDDGKMKNYTFEEILRMDDERECQ